MGEMDKSVLRVGGLAGVLAGIILVVGLILVFTQLPPFEGIRQDLAGFQENITVLLITTDLLLLFSLLLIPFYAALYWSLREPSRVFGRIGLYSGVFAAVLSILAAVGIFVSTVTFAGLFDDPTVQDKDLVVATFGVTASLLFAGQVAGGLITGFAFVVFGFAMRGSRDYQGGFAWLSILLGIIAVLFGLLFAPLGGIPLAVFALALGWKLYGLSGAA